MHGRVGGEDRKLSRHMWSVPSTTTKAAAGVSDSNGCSASFFYKDVRKISIGDCALFKPQQDSPPFIGIIRSLGSDKEKSLQLGVNWLYRPADVKLLKGISPEAAPNEVFYSFHRDETPAASLLHPCKVAFLPRGVELPSGISSFVCRRVYDTANKRLWWLTDQDYIDDRQEEVDKLLRKTQSEMHATVQQQQGGRSPKPVNSPMSTSQLKQSPDSVQNSTSVFPSQSKGKKRERSDQATDPVKRERSSKADDGDSGLPRSEGMLKSEIAKITEKGGLVDSAGVARLVHLMQPDKPEKKMDVICRSLLAGVIAATDKVDCLNQFVQLRGLRVFDEWLQEAHKGKIGDSSSPRDQDKSVEDFLLVLLRALDKLPVNLNALQMCNIGKSVNHLRSHRNSEIQKKARSLVDTWKKRVEAEMIINDTKSGTSHSVSWPARTRNEVSQVANRHAGGSSDATMKNNSFSQLSSSKSAPVKLVQGEVAAKSPSASASPGNIKLASSPRSTSASVRDAHLRTSVISGSSELPQSAARDEKSSGSSHSHTNSQCSSDHAKNAGPSVKEDARSSNSGSTSLNKSSGNGSRHKKTANGVQVPAVSAHQKDGGSSRNSSLTRISATEKLSQPPACEKTLDARDEKNSGPVHSEKHDQSDASVRGNKVDSHQFHEVDGSSTSSPQRTSDNRRINNVSKNASSPSRNDMKSRKAHDSSFSSMNALIESCANYSEASMPISAADDVGMNLLASVAASEISRSGIVSPAVSPLRNSKLGETSSHSHVVIKKDSHGDDVIEGGQSTDGAGNDNQNHVAVVSNVDGECSKLCDNKPENSPQNVEGCLMSNGTLDDKHGSASPHVSIACTARKSEGDLGAESGNKRNIVAKEEIQNEPSVASQSLDYSLEAEDKVKVASSSDDFEKKAQHDGEKKCNVVQGLKGNILPDQNAHVAALQSVPTDTDEKSVTVSCGTSQHMAAVISNDVKTEKNDGVVCDDAGQAGERMSDKEGDSSCALDKQGEPGNSSADVCQEKVCNDQNFENKEAPGPGSSATQLSCSAVVLPDTIGQAAEGTNSTAVEEENKADDGSAAESVASESAPGCPAADVKLGFDLNEGFYVDEGKNGEPVDFAAGPSQDIVRSVSPLQFPVSSASCSLPASVTVTAAAKGPFVPADDLLWTKPELGWKGSAATSAFRPAEPRKVMEVPLGPSKAPLPDAPAPARFPLDIDLNVADESSGQDSDVRNDSRCELMTTTSLRSSGGLDLDLNKMDEAPDMAYAGQQTTSNIPRTDFSPHHIKSLSLNVFSNGSASGKRDFDLNNGPATEDSPVEQILSSHHNRGNINLQPSLGPRINSSNAGNSFSWYPPGTNYSVSVTPTALLDREAFSIVGMGGGPQRVLGGPTSLPFNSDGYRGSVLSSSPALPFQPTPFQYPVLPYGTSFPVPSPSLAGGSSGYMDPATGGRMSAMPSQMVGNAAAMSFQYPHAYVVSRSIPDVSNNGVFESSHVWGKQGLDLNSGPGVLDMEGRDESLPTATRQASTITPQSLAEEQARMYGMGGGHSKRKEPDGGWNIDKLNVKQSPWR